MKANELLTVKAFWASVTLCSVLMAASGATACRSPETKPDKAQNGPAAVSPNGVPPQLQFATESPKTITVPVSLTIETSNVTSKQTVPIDLQVNAKSPTAVTVPVNLEVVKQPVTPLTLPVEIQAKMPPPSSVSVPVSLTISAAASSPIEVPIKITPQNPEPLVVPIEIQYRSRSRGRESGGGGSSWRIGRDIDGGTFSSGKGDSNPGGEVDGPNIRAWKTQLWILGIVVVLAGILGGLLRYAESYRRYREHRSTLLYDFEQSRAEELRIAKSQERPPRVELLEEQFRNLKRTASAITLSQLASDVLWGILSASLVPALLAVSDSSVLDRLQDNAGYVTALWGFCLVAATIGGEFFYLTLTGIRSAIFRNSQRLP